MQDAGDRDSICSQGEAIQMYNNSGLLYINQKWTILYTFPLKDSFIKTTYEKTKWLRNSQPKDIYSEDIVHNDIKSTSMIMYPKPTCNS